MPNHLEWVRHRRNAITAADCEPISMGATAHNVIVTDTLPAGTVYQLFSSDNGFMCTHANGVVTCSGGTLAVDTSANITIVVRAPNAAATLTNTARVDPNNAISERNEANNSTSLTSTVS